MTFDLSLIGSDRRAVIFIASLTIVAIAVPALVSFTSQDSALHVPVMLSL
jgi:hypothetical protein